MAKLAIKGHPYRGKEVIEILEMLGGKIRRDRLAGNEFTCWYYINENGYIDYKHYTLFSDTIGFTLEEVLEKFPYKVGDKVHNIINNENQTITNLVWDFQENEVVYKTNNNEYVYVNYLQPYKEETMEGMDEKAVNHVYETEVISFDIAQRDKYELDLQGKFKVVLREGKYYVERIKPKYPTTYVECARMLNCFGAAHIDGYKGELLDKFQELLICRDAYWKLAGDWKPDWKDTSQSKHSIWFNNEGICTKSNRVSYAVQHILTFPTQEMRDEFYNNFKSLVEEVKELL